MSTNADAYTANVGVCCGGARVRSASVLRFWTMAARWNSSHAPERPLSRMRSKLWWVFRCANLISARVLSSRDLRMLLSTSRLLFARSGGKPARTGALSPGLLRGRGRACSNVYGTGGLAVTSAKFSRSLILLNGNQSFSGPGVDLRSVTRKSGRSDSMFGYGESLGIVMCDAAGARSPWRSFW